MIPPEKTKKICKSVLTRNRKMENTLLGNSILDTKKIKMVHLNKPEAEILNLLCDIQYATLIKHETSLIYFW